AVPRPGSGASRRRGHRAARSAAVRAAPAEARMTQPLLALEEVRYRHGSGREAVCGVSLRVDPGEVVGLIGPNAAGKSTLARIACGLLRPATGTVRLRGDDAFALARRERASRVAFLYTDVAADLPFTARDMASIVSVPTC